MWRQEVMDVLPTKLKTLRNKTNLTQSEFAKKIDVARTTYAMYEQGHREPDYETLQRIADFYDVTTDYLLGRTERVEQNTVNDKDNKTFFMSKIATEFPDIDLMFKDMQSLSADDMKEVYEYIKFKKSQKNEK